LNNEVTNRGKVKQTQTFQSPTLSQTAQTTFGFLRLMVDATLNGEDSLSLRLITQSEILELVKTKDAVQLFVNQVLIKEVKYSATSVTLQWVINDERVGCFVIGKRIHTLANRLSIASFYNQPFVFEVTATINQESTMVLKELVYEYVNE